MEVRTFRATSLQEALQQVRESLGPDANVLHTRERKHSRFGMFQRSYVEVDASRDVPVASRFDSPTVSTPSANSPQAEASIQTAGNGQTGQQAVNVSTADSVRWSSMVRDAVPTSQNSSPASQNSGPASQPTASLSQDSVAAALTASGSAKLRAAESLAEVSPKPRFDDERRSNESMSPAMLEVLSELLDGGMPPQVARGLLRAAVDACGEEMPDDAWLINGQISQRIAASLHVGGSIELADGEQQVVALVGSTGVGKTTTLAKIAAGLRFDLGLDVGLITLDTFRLGAVDQLLQYAELISAPLEVVSSADQVVGALQRLRESDVVLIDTAGRSPRDSEQITVLGDFLRAAQPTSTHLVVSSASSPAHAAATLQSFAKLKPSNLMITKIDESVHFGGWLPLLQTCPLPISYVTAGQHVPEDIMVATRRRMASLILGHTQQRQAS